MGLRPTNGHENHVVRRRVFNGVKCPHAGRKSDENGIRVEAALEIVDSTGVGEAARVGSRRIFDGVPRGSFEVYVPDLFQARFTLRAVDFENDNKISAFGVLVDGIPLVRFAAVAEGPFP